MGVRVRLEPTRAQEAALARHAGASRWAYNWGLEIRRQAWERAGVSENAITLHRLLNSLKAKHHPWLYEVSKCAPQEALRDLDTAYGNWWRRLKEGKKGRAAGAPRFKSRQRDGVGGFRLTGSIQVKDGKIALPRIGSMRLAEAGRFPQGKLSQVTIREGAGNWYASAHVPARVKTGHGQRKRRAAPVGVDLGVKDLAVLSDGTRHPAPRALRRSLRRLARLEREKSRRKPGSRNRERTRARIARQHERVANRRGDANHKLTTHLATTCTTIVIEDLNVKGMTKTHGLALSVSDAALGEFRQQLQYKCEWYGTRLELASRWFPSTQKCSGCGAVKTGSGKLSLSTRSFSCDACGLSMDRDENAARNLAALAGSDETAVLVAGSCPETLINACGAKGAGRDHGGPAKPIAMKQGPDRRTRPALITA